MESFAPIVSIKTLFEQVMNWWLQYVLAQPIQIDLAVILVLALEFSNVPRILVWLQEVNSILQNMLKPQFNQLILEEA